MFLPHVIKSLYFFVLCDPFRIANGTLVLTKDENDTSIQKLTVVHVSATKHPLKVNTCPE